MVDIETALKQIQTARYGKDVRASIHDSIEQIWKTYNGDLSVISVQPGQQDYSNLNSVTQLKSNRIYEIQKGVTNSKSLDLPAFAKNHHCQLLKYTSRPLASDRNGWSVYILNVYPNSGESFRTYIAVGWENATNLKKTDWRQLTDNKVLESVVRTYETVYISADDVAKYGDYSKWPLNRIYKIGASTNNTDVTLLPQGGSGLLVHMGNVTGDSWGSFDIYMSDGDTKTGKHNRTWIRFAVNGYTPNVGWVPLAFSDVTNYVNNAFVESVGDISKWIPNQSYKVAAEVPVDKSSLAVQASSVVVKFGLPNRLGYRPNDPWGWSALQYALVNNKVRVYGCMGIVSGSDSRPVWVELTSGADSGRLKYDDDIALPSTINIMAGHELPIYFDTLSRYDESTNLWKISLTGVDVPAFKRNELCLTWTPGDSATNTSMTVSHVSQSDLSTVQSKTIQIHVNHKVTKKITKGILIMGDSITDDNYTAQEVYKLLTADGDFSYNMIGTRGPADGKHEAHSGWGWWNFLDKKSTNPFYNESTGKVDIKSYCRRNNLAYVDYFLVNLGTNHLTQGSKAHTSEDSDIKNTVNLAKRFIDILLNADTGFPNCKVGIAMIPTGAEYFFRPYWSSEVFKISANTLNHAYLDAFDNGKYKSNITCFALGSYLNRRYAFPYTESACSKRFNETVIKYTDHVHPSERGRRALAEGYYNQIRAWISEDAK